MWKCLSVGYWLDITEPSESIFWSLIERIIVWSLNISQMISVKWFLQVE